MQWMDGKQRYVLLYSDTLISSELLMNRVGRGIIQSVVLNACVRA